LTPRAYPYSIAATADGSEWFTELFRNRVGKLDAAGHITEFALPRHWYWISTTKIVRGADGNAWVLAANNSNGESDLCGIDSTGHMHVVPLDGRFKGMSVAGDGNFVLLAEHSISWSTPVVPRSAKPEWTPASI